MEVISPEKLRELRRRVGLTQAELARRAGVSQSLISRLEAGTVSPRISTLAKIYSALREYVEEVAVDEVMYSPVIAARVDERLEHIVGIMWSRGISQVPVLDEDGNVVGTIHERDVVEAFLRYRERANHFKALEIMSGPLPTVLRDAKLSSVIEILRGGVPAILVVEGGKLVGIVTKSDLMRFFAGLKPSS